MQRHYESHPASAATENMHPFPPKDKINRDLMLLLHSESPPITIPVVKSVVTSAVPIRSNVKKKSLKAGGRTERMQ